MSPRRSASPVPAAPAPRGLFVTGTDTGVGKTLVSAWLVRSLGADYWKPVQSGITEGTDSDTVAALAPEAVLHPPTYLLQEPLSPHEAAILDGVQIELDRFRLPATPRPLIVEGAGGVMVPLNKRDCMIDLMAQLGLPVVLVARGELGTINHSLLSLAALRQRGLTIAGVIFSGSLRRPNLDAIATLGQVPVLGHLPRLDDPLRELPGQPSLQTPALTALLDAASPSPDLSRS